MLGTWWVPNPPEDDHDYEPPEGRVSGNFDGDGPWHLSTLGRLSPGGLVEELKSMGDNYPPRYDTIWGTTSEERSLSLFDMWRTGASLGGGSPLGGKERWRVGWYTSGNVWVFGREDIDRVSIRLNTLGDWASDHGLVNDGFAVEDGALRLPQEITHTAAIGDATLSLDIGSEVNAMGSGGGYTANRYSSLNIADRNVRLDEVTQKWVIPLMRLLDLLTAMPTRATDISLRLPGQHASGASRLLNLYPNLIQAKEERDTWRGRLDMLATRAVLEQYGLDFSALISRFFELYETEGHGRALNLLSHSQARVLDGSASAELMGTFMAVEHYHREEIGGFAIPESTHNKRVAEVLRVVPDEHKCWVKNALSPNRKSTPVILQEVTDRATTTGKAVTEAWPRFCKEATRLRVQAAHGTPETRVRIGLRQHAGAVSIRWVLRHVYLLKLGLSEASAEQLVQNNPLFQQDMELVEEWHRENPQ